MESNKIDQEVKALLQKRHIQPSEGSWEKLEARLQTGNLAVGKRKWWIGASAAAVAAVMLSLFLLHREPTSPALVEEPVNEINREPATKNDLIPPVKIASEDRDEELRSSEKEVISSEEVASSEEPFQVSEENPAPVKYIVLEGIELNPPMENEREFSEEIKGLLAKVEEKEKSGNTVSDAEIDALLAEAAAKVHQKEFTPNREFDADNLLAEVEDEIYQSFKEKIFIVLKEGFIKAKTAVANRNN